MNWLNYHHLFYFHVIAKEGSIAKASRKLRLGQSALSIQLKQLEESLGAQLFERKSQKLTLTRIGKTVFDYATSIFKLGNEMVETVKENRATKMIKLDIGVLDSVPKSVSHHLLVEALKTNQCYVSVTEASNQELLNDLMQHKLHLILTNTHAPVTSQSEFFSRCVGEFPVVICAAPKFRHLKKNFPHSLSNKPFILPMPQSKLRSDLEYFFELNKVYPLILGDSQESELDKRLALSGHAIVAISKHAVSAELKAKKLVILGEIHSVKDQIWLTGIRRHKENSVASILLETFSLR